MPNDKTTELVLAYYDSWKNGSAAYDDARLRDILASDLKFEGPIAGKRDSADTFLPGLLGFARTLESLRVLHLVSSGDEAAVLYDCDVTMPAGTFRFAEFFRIEGERIQEIKLLFDATEFRKLTGPPAA